MHIINIYVSTGCNYQYKHNKIGPLRFWFCDCEITNYYYDADLKKKNNLQKQTP